MKNENMVRKMDHGRKEIWFKDITCLGRFVNMYKDLFFPTNWNCGNFAVDEEELVDGTSVWKLACLMRHDDFNNIKENLNMKRRTIIWKLTNEHDFKRNVFVCGNGWNKRKIRA